MNNAFDRANIGLRERPVSSDHNRLQCQLDRSLRDTLRALYGARTQSAGGALVSYSGMIGDGLRVVPTSPGTLGVQVSAGLGFIYDASDVPTSIGAPDLENVDDRSPWKPVLLNAPAVFPVALAGTGLQRIDIIEVKHDRRLEDSVARRQLDTATKAFVDHSFYKTLAFSLDGRTGTVNTPTDSTAGLSYKVGAENASPVAPPTTAGYVKLAEIRVTDGGVSITGLAISDMRPLLHPGGVATASIRYRVQWNGGDPILTVLDLVAPAGVEIAARAVATKGRSEVYAVGGNILRASVQAGVEQPAAILGTAPHVVARAYPGTAGVVGDLVATIDLGEQVVFAVASPAITTGRAAQRAGVLLDALYADAAGAADVTNAALEDLVFNVEFQLGYI